MLGECLSILDSDDSRAILYGGTGLIEPYDAVGDVVKTDRIANLFVQIVRRCLPQDQWLASTL